MDHFLRFGYFWLDTSSNPDSNNDRTTTTTTTTATSTNYDSLVTIADNNGDTME